MNRFSINLSIIVFFTLIFQSVLCQNNTCDNGLAYIVETIPDDLTIKPNHTTYETFLDIINSSTSEVVWCGFYFTLSGGDAYPAQDGGYRGLDVLNALRTASKRGVKIRIVLMPPSKDFPQTDAIQLYKDGVAEVEFIDWKNVFGAGILHTKMILSDQSRGYIGSANSDWRSLCQVKEMGVYVKDCPLVVGDAWKIFEEYWHVAVTGSLETPWSSYYNSDYNVTNPMIATFNGEKVPIYAALTPHQLESGSRQSDISALTSVINGANETVNLQVMDYLPYSIYTQTQFYWGVIDDAIRGAAQRGVQVRLLFGVWNNTFSGQKQYELSLAALDNVEVRNFVMPPLANSPQIPYTRVNHAKFLFSESNAWIGTSNMTPGYFITTGGISWNFYKTGSLLSDLTEKFDRDWNSEYAVPVTCTN